MSDNPKSSKPLRVSVFGLGYVGSVMAACLARLGHHVLATEVNPDKVEMLNSGRSPIVEPGMEELVAEEHRAGRLSATRDPVRAVVESELSLIAVGTPSLENGDVDLGALERVCRDAGQAIALKAGFHTVAVRSTVLPGTAGSVVLPALERASGKRSGEGFAVCANPEFMREGSAIADFMNPPFTILGGEERSHLAPLKALYHALPGRVFETSLRTAEMVKYVCNAFHALKVVFANETGALCRESGVSAGEVMEIFLSDTKLNLSAAYLNPGFAFGGSCLPKDLRALNHRARQSGLKLPLLGAILESNQAHIERAVARILATGRKKIGVLGLSFKPGTDDLRESAMLQVVQRLLGEGCEVRIHDPHVAWSSVRGANREFALTRIPRLASLFRPSLEDVVRESEVVVVGSGGGAEYARLGELLRRDQSVFDFAHLENPPAGAQGLCW